MSHRYMVRIPARRVSLTSIFMCPHAAIILDRRGYAVELNNVLTGHPSGNLTRFFYYMMPREGRDDAPIHVAVITKCENLLVPRRSARLLN